MMRTKRRMGWVSWSLIVLAIIVLVLFGIWRWAVYYGSAGTLDWVDARFSRESAVELVAAEQYGSDPAQRIELYLPTGQHLESTAAHPDSEIWSRPEYPVVIFIHGGGWHSGAPEDYRFVARAMGDMGYATALVGYRLVPDGKFPAMLDDSAAAVKWVVDQGAQHSLDTDRLTLMGHSAGAYNALMLGLDRQWLGREGLSGETIKGVISLAGPADFYPFDKDSSRNAFGDAKMPELTQPINFVRSDAPPVLLLHGDADTVVKPRNSRVLDDALRQAGGQSVKVEYPGMSHAGIIMAFARPFDRDRKVIKHVQAFLKKVGAKQPSAPVQAEKP